ncbi:MAG: helix-turn-helix domain containing protein [Clostridioides sp.]|jgi:hypothetical protein|nr:helix-turn-helix domain containing protein [Clostridioides sp.]
MCKKHITYVNDRYLEVTVEQENLLYIIGYYAFMDAVDYCPGFAIKIPTKKNLLKAERDMEIRKMYLSGEDIRVICKQFGITDTTCRKAIKRAEKLEVECKLAKEKSEMNSEDNIEEE